MQAYSRSQGKIIDVPDTQTTQQTTGGSGINGDQLKQAALMDLLTTGGKNISKIQAVQSMFSDTQGKKDAAALRKEFSTETKNLGFQELQNSWNKVQNAGEGGAGDLTIVYSYIKALDPTTAVREGEINLTKAAESIPSNIIRAYNKAKQGQAISPQVRQQMIAEIGTMYNERAKKQQELNAFYSGLASDSGLDPKDVIGRVGTIEFADIPTTAGQTVNPGVGSRLVAGAKNNLNSILGIPGALLQETGSRINQVVTNPREALRQYPETVKEGIKATTYGPLASVLGEYNQLLGEPLKGGDVFGRAVNRAIDNPVYTALDLLPFLKSKGVKLPKVKGPMESVGNMRQQAAEVAQKSSGGIAGEALTKAGRNTLKTATGTTRGEIAQFVEADKPVFGGRAISIEESLDILKSANTAYTAAGKVGRTAEAMYNKAIGDAIRGELQRVAPDVAKANKLFNFLYNAPKIAQKTSWLALKATGIGKLLGL